MAPLRPRLAAVSGPPREYRLRLSIGPDEMLRYYRGSAAAVQALSEEGVRVRFPANTLRPFMTAQGIHGRFCLRVDGNNRVLGLELLED